VLSMDGISARPPVENPPLPLMPFRQGIGVAGVVPPAMSAMIAEWSAPVIQKSALSPES